MREAFVHELNAFIECQDVNSFEPNRIESVLEHVYTEFKRAQTNTKELARLFALFFRKCIQSKGTAFNKQLQDRLLQCLFQLTAFPEVGKQMYSTNVLQLLAKAVSTHPISFAKRVFFLFQRMFPQFEQEQIDQLSVLLSQSIAELIISPKHRDPSDRQLMDQCLAALAALSCSKKVCDQIQTQIRSALLQSIEGNLNSERLDKQLAGLHTLVQIIQESSWQEPPSFIPSRDTIREWIFSQNVLQKILEQNSHVQLITKSLDIFLFIIPLDDKAFQFCLDRLFNYPIGKHESVIEQVYDTISQILPNLAQESILYIYETISLIPKTSWTTHLINLIAFVNSFAEPVHVQNGLSLLWTVIEDEESQPEMKSAALNQFLETLKISPDDEYRRLYVSQCLTSSRFPILSSILQTFPTAADAIKALKDISEDNLIDRLIEKLCTKPADQLFDLLKYVLIHGYALLNVDGICTLWSACSHLPRFYQWLSELFSDTSPLEEDAFRYLFSEVSSIKVQDFTPETFHLFRKGFYLMNTMDSNILISAPSDEFAIVSHPWGIELLWKLSLEHPNPLVYSLASDFLVFVYSQSCEDEEFTESFIDTLTLSPHVERCMDLLERLSDDLLLSFAQSEDAIDYLFHLIERPELAARVWGFISSLPPQKETVRLDQLLEWNESQNSLFKLLFHLQSIEKQAFHSTERQQWIDTYNSTQGIIKIIHLLYSLPSLSQAHSFQAEIVLQCILILFKFISLSSLSQVSPSISYSFTIFPELAIPESSLDPTSLDLSFHSANISQLISHICSLISSICCLEQSFDFLAGPVVWEALVIIIPLMHSEPRYIQEIFLPRRFKRMLKKIVLSPLPLVRSMGFKSILFIVTRHPTLLLDVFRTVFNSILVTLVSGAFDESLSKDLFTFLQTFYSLFKPDDEIFNHCYQALEAIQFSETEWNSSEEFDYILSGILSILMCFPPQDSSDLSQVVCTYLFSVSDQAQLVCMSKPSRFAAFSLLLHLAKSPTHWQYIQSYLSDLLELHGWAKYPIEPKYNYVGLVNQANTCYMNSCLQQLFMNAKLRKYVLNCPKIDDPILNEIQVMFAFMQKSIRKSFDTFEFCQTPLGIDGNAVDITEQMDANEFLNILFDKLDTALKDTDFKDMLKNVFGGSFSQQIVCQACKNVSERIEPFYTVAVNSKHKPNVKAGLSLFVEGELLSDSNAYFCSQCQTKQTALKRTCISEFPDTLILALKRFDFNYDSMSRVKLDDVCEFGMEINMMEYSKDYLEWRENGGTPPDAQDYLYDLIGILVHVGTTESGHYYSYIRETLPNGSRGEWFEFNDINVSPFDPRRIPEECFGGFKAFPHFDQKLARNVKGRFPKSNNAYMLFYEKRSVDHISDKQFQIPQEIEASIQKDNVRLLKDLILFDSSMEEFVRSFIQLMPVGCDETYTSPSQIPTDSIRNPILAFHFMFQVHFQSGYSEGIKEWSNYLEHCLRQSMPFCVWFLQYLRDHKQLLIKSLLVTSEEVCRSNFAILLLRAIEQVRPFERSRYMDYVNSNAEQRNQVIAPLLDTIILLVLAVHKHWRKSEQFFSLVKEISMLGHFERQVFASRNILSEFVALYEGKPSPFVAKRSNSISIARKKNQIPTKDLDDLVDTVAMICCSSVSRCPSSWISPSLTIPLSEQSVVSPEFLYDVLKNNVNTLAATRIILHQSYDNFDTSMLLLDMLLQGFDRLDEDYYEPFKHCTISLLLLVDSLQSDRIDYFLPRFIADLQTNDQFEGAVQNCLAFLKELCSRCTLLSTSLLADPESLAKLDQLHASSCSVLQLS